MQPLLFGPPLAAHPNAPTYGFQGPIAILWSSIPKFICFPSSLTPSLSAASVNTTLLSVVNDSVPSSLASTAFPYFSSSTSNDVDTLSNSVTDDVSNAAPKKRKIHETGDTHISAKDTCETHSLLKDIDCQVSNDGIDLTGPEEAADAFSVADAPDKNNFSQKNAGRRPSNEVVIDLTGPEVVDLTLSSEDGSVHSPATSRKL